MTSPSALAPVAPGERIATLDILRGFALLGILVINMPGFAVPWAVWPSGEEWFPGAPDRAAEFLVDFFGSGKFNSIFSFLFGLGLAIQLERAAARRASFVPLYLRRLLALAAFGLAHAFLIWTGDVLHIYAVVGLFLLVARRLPDRTIAVVMALLLVLPLAWNTYELAINKPPDHPPSYYSARAREQLHIFGQGSYPEMVRERVREMREEYVDSGDGYWFWCSLSFTMLLGFLAGRHRVFQTLPQHLPWIRRLRWWTLGLGLSTGLIFAVCAAWADPTKPTVLGLLTGVFYEVNRPLLCLFYITSLTLLAQQAGWARRLAPIALVGRMPLTNYLMQSLLCTTIFNSYGLGLFGTVGPAMGLLIAAVVYTAQIMYSRWWMARFAYGPLEWVWRLLTYGRAPSMKPVEKRAAAA